MSEHEKVITLRRPIVLGDLSYDSITVREPTLDEIDQAQKQPSKIGIGAALLSAVSGIPLAVIRKLPISEFNRASGALTDFMTDSPSTGES